jgi:hypothetical protein
MYHLSFARQAFDLTISMMCAVRSDLNLDRECTAYSFQGLAYAQRRFRNALENEGCDG